MPAFPVFALFAAVELRDGPVIAHHSGPDFAAGSIFVSEDDGICFHVFGLGLNESLSGRTAMGA